MFLAKLPFVLKVAGNDGNSYVVELPDSRYESIIYQSSSVSAMKEIEKREGLYTR